MPHACQQLAADHRGQEQAPSTAQKIGRSLPTRPPKNGQIIRNADHDHPHDDPMILKSNRPHVDQRKIARMAIFVIPNVSRKSHEHRVDDGVALTCGGASSSSVIF